MTYQKIIIISCSHKRAHKWQPKTDAVCAAYDGKTALFAKRYLKIISGRGWETTED